MSTKSTLILTQDNEHWYKDCNAKCFVLEFDKKHKVEVDEEGTRIIIESNTPLYEKLYKILYPKEGIAGG